MIHGTHTSDFYREIRNLLHDQEGQQARQTAASADPDGNHGRAELTLDQRWRALLVREVEYRSQPHQPAANG